MAGLTISPAALREQTNAAIAKGQKRRADELKQQEDALRRKAEAEASRADGILRGLPAACEEAAAREQSYVVVMRVRERDDYIVPAGVKRRDPDVIEGEWLIGAALLVWKSCVTAGFEPFFTFDYSNGGEDSWHNLTVRW